MNIFPFYIGTRGVAAKPSVYRCLADFDCGTFTTLYSVKGLSSPTYLAASENDCLYAVGKSPDGDCVYALRESLSMASAIGRDPMTIISTLPSAGKGPTHLSVDSRGEFLVCANYGSGGISLYTLAPDGRILAQCDSRQYTGVGFDAQDRQQGPHAHFAAFHPQRDEVLVCDLGLDMVYVYTLDRTEARLKDTGRSIHLPNGAGPRHLAFSDAHPDFLYILTEMANTVFVYCYDQVQRQYECVQTISAVPDPTEQNGIAPSSGDLMVPLTADNGSIGCAIRFSDDGAYLFVSSRLGYQSITAYRCGDDGLLHFCSRCSCGGITPRDFNVFADVSGTGQQGGSDKSDHPDDYILVANQDSDLITALRFTRADESLALLDMEMQVDKPTCILPVL